MKFTSLNSSARVRAAICTMIVLSTTAASAATINELRIDQTGADNDEYFELAGSPGESLDDLFFIALQDDGIVDAAADLDGLTIPADGYFLAAENTFTLAPGQVDLIVNLNFENSENATYLLVSQLGAGVVGTDLDSDDDGVLDSTPWASLVDGLSLIGGTDDVDYSASLGIPAVGPDGAFLPGHVFAIPNGSDSYRIGGFTAGTDDTPGTANVPEPASIALTLLAGLALIGIPRRSGR